MYGGKLDFLDFETVKEERFYLLWTPTPFLRQFHEEFKRNSTTFLSFKEYERIMKIGETKKPHNPLGCALSLYAQDEERKCVTVAIETFQEDDFKTGTIIHDGFLVENLDVPDAILRKAEEQVKSHTGYDVKLERKSLKEFDAEIHNR